MLGQEGATRIDVDAMEERIAANEDLRESLADVDLASAILLLGTYAGQGPELEPWLRHVDPDGLHRMFGCFHHIRHIHSSLGPVNS